MDKFTSLVKPKNHEEILKKEQEILKKESTPEFEYRLLRRDDYDRGFMDVLALLTVVGKVTKQDFEKRFDEMFPSHDHVYKIVVIVDRETDKIVGCGTIFIEKKFIRQSGIVTIGVV